MECFLRSAKFLAKNSRGLKITRKILRGLKIFPYEKNKGCETIRVQNFPVPERIIVMKFSSARENKGMKFSSARENKRYE